MYWDGHQNRRRSWIARVAANCNATTKLTSQSVLSIVNLDNPELVAVVQRLMAVHRSRGGLQGGYDGGPRFGSSASCARLPLHVLSAFSHLALPLQCSRQMKTLPFAIVSLA